VHPVRTGEHLVVEEFEAIEPDAGLGASARRPSLTGRKVSRIESNETMSCCSCVWCRMVAYSTGWLLVTTLIMCSGIGSSSASYATDHHSAS